MLGRKGLVGRWRVFQVPGGGNLDVEVEVWVQEITTISDITSDFQLDIYISVSEFRTRIDGFGKPMKP